MEGGGKLLCTAHLESSVRENCRSGSNDKPLPSINTSCGCENRRRRTLQSMPASASAREAAVMAQGRRQPQSSITLRKKESQRCAVKRQRRTQTCSALQFRSWESDASRGLEAERPASCSVRRLANEGGEWTESTKQCKWEQTMHLKLAAERRFFLYAATSHVSGWRRRHGGRTAEEGGATCFPGR